MDRGTGGRAPLVDGRARPRHSLAVHLYRTLGLYLLRPGLRAMYRVEVSGGERIPLEGPCIVASNHESTVDPFIMGLVTGRVVHWMAKSELWDNKLAAKIVDGFGAIRVDRGRGDRSAYERARSLLDEGRVVGIFPQGTCLPIRERPYYRTTAKLALDSGAPLIPVGLVGTERVLRPHRTKLGLPKVRIIVGRPIRVDQQKPTMVTARAVTRGLETAIRELCRPYGEPKHVWLDQTTPIAQPETIAASYTPMNRSASASQE